MRDLPLNTFAIAMSRITVEQMRTAAFPVTPTEAMISGVEPRTIGGIELRVSPFVPEQMAAALDRHGNVLGIIDMRPRKPNQWGRDAAYRAEYRRLAGNPDPMFGLRTTDGWTATTTPTGAQRHEG